VLGRPISARRSCGNSHNVARMRLNYYAAGFYEELAFNHEVVLAVRMLIRPRLRSQFPLKQQENCGGRGRSEAQGAQAH
jgi:hypothetical protein